MTNPKLPLERGELGGLRGPGHLRLRSRMTRLTKPELAQNFSAGSLRVLAAATDRTLPALQCVVI
jgi:hypothetical protein